MAFAGSVAHAQRLRRDDHIDINNHDQHARSTPSSVDSTTVQAPEAEPEGSKSEEAQAFEADVDKLMSCPCLDEIKASVCGETFKDAFKCFILSNEPEKGADCVDSFTKLEDCMQTSPQMFKDVMTKRVQGEDPKIPAVPASVVRVPDKLAEWSKKL